MKKIYDKLNELKRELESKIEDRETTYDDRTDKWRDSDAGTDYESKTGELEEVAYNLEEAINCLEQFLEM